MSYSFTGDTLALAFNFRDTHRDQALQISARDYRTNAVRAHLDFKGEGASVGSPPGVLYISLAIVPFDFLLEADYV
ncbi:MAG: hypothetical protein ACLGJB_25850 [Blastocatellia bacterium]